MFVDAVAGAVAGAVAVVVVVVVVVVVPGVPDTWKIQVVAAPRKLQALKLGAPNRRGTGDVAMGIVDPKSLA